MPSLKALSMRLKSVGSTSKITKAMKLVAASKLRGAETRMKGGMPFAKSMSSLMDTILTPGEEDKAENPVLLAISSDKGLCGGVNARVVKEVKLRHEAATAADTKVPELLIVGGKARDGLQRTHSKMISSSIDEVYQGPVTFSLASFLAEHMLETPSDEYTILYNQFKSVINFEVMPITMKGPEVLGGSGVMDEFEFEGDKEVILAHLYQFNLAARLYGCLLENVTSEQASRMTAMDSASNNATELVGKLQLQYNRQRQFVITTELTEIVAGAESV